MFFLLLIPLLHATSLAEKVGQLLIPAFHGTTYNDNARTLVEELHVGGIIYYNWANDLSTPSQTAALSHSLQAHAKTPLFLMVDQEGGRVQRLPFLQTPSPDTLTPTTAYNAAYKTGRSLLSLGINFNLAPVADIDFGTRSYPDTETLRAALAGYTASGIFTCLKHFPGHGATRLDTHTHLPTIPHLSKKHLAPFLTLNPTAIMTAHILIPTLDRANCATTSPHLLSLLRSHFSGLIITDSLTMQGLLYNTGTVEEAAIRALLAGADLLLLSGKSLLGHAALSPTEVTAIRDAILDAIATNRLPRARIEDAYFRILRQKNHKQV